MMAPKYIQVLIPGSVNVTYENLKMRLRILRMEDYLGGSSVMTWIIESERARQEKEMQ